MNNYKSRRPSYADDEPPAKFQALMGIICTRLKQYPNAICSYSGGSDSDIMIDLIERTRKIFNLPPVKYVFFNTGLEMDATKRHVKETAEKYGVEIEEVRPKINIVKATREHGIPFMSKIFSQRMNKWQKESIPLSIVDEFNSSTNKYEKLKELEEKYPKCKTLIRFLCSCDKRGRPWSINKQMVINSEKYMLDFIREYPPDFQISAKCCDYCKKQLAHRVQKPYDLIITGERLAEGGVRSLNITMLTNPLNTMCFFEQSDGKHRLRPLFYVTDRDKAWYKEYYGITYSDAYEVYGLTRTGCCGCPISYEAVDNLDKIRPYEPNVVKAAWNIFGDSYRYRQAYNAYKEQRKAEDKAKKKAEKDSKQITFFEEEEGHNEQIY